MFYELNRRNVDLAQLFNFVLGNGGFLLKSCKEPFSFLGSWVGLGRRLVLRNKNQFFIVSVSCPVEKKKPLFLQMTKNVIRHGVPVVFIHN